MLPTGNQSQNFAPPSERRREQWPISTLHLKYSRSYFPIYQERHPEKIGKIIQTTVWLKIASYVLKKSKRTPPSHLTSPPLISATSPQLVGKREPALVSRNPPLYFLTDGAGGQTSTLPTISFLEFYLNGCSYACCAPAWSSTGYRGYMLLGFPFLGAP